LAASCTASGATGSRQAHASARHGGAAASADTRPAVLPPGVAQLWLELDRPPDVGFHLGMSGEFVVRGAPRQARRGPLSACLHAGGRQGDGRARRLLGPGERKPRGTAGRGWHAPRHRPLACRIRYRGDARDAAGAGDDWPPRYWRYAFQLDDGTQVRPAGAACTGPMCSRSRRRGARDARRLGAPLGRRPARRLSSPSSTLAALGA
jgi:hypothetical protein